MFLAFLACGDFLFSLFPPFAIILLSSSNKFLASCFLKYETMLPLLLRQKNNRVFLETQGMDFFQRGEMILKNGTVTKNLIDLCIFEFCQ